MYPYYSYISSLEKVLFYQAIVSILFHSLFFTLWFIAVTRIKKLYLARLFHVLVFNILRFVKNRALTIVVKRQFQIVEGLDRFKRMYTMKNISKISYFNNNDSYIFAFLLTIFILLYFSSNSICNYLDFFPMNFAHFFIALGKGFLYVPIVFITFFSLAMAFSFSNMLTSSILKEFHEEYELRSESGVNPSSLSISQDYLNGNWFREIDRDKAQLNSNNLLLKEVRVGKYTYTDIKIPTPRISVDFSDYLFVEPSNNQTAYSAQKNGETLQSYRNTTFEEYENPDVLLMKSITMNAGFVKRMQEWNMYTMIWMISVIMMYHFFQILGLLIFLF